MDNLISWEEVNLKKKTAENCEIIISEEDYGELNTHLSEMGLV